MDASVILIKKIQKKGGVHHFFCLKIKISLFVVVLFGFESHNCVKGNREISFGLNEEFLKLEKKMVVVVWWVGVKVRCTIWIGA